MCIRDRDPDAVAQFAASSAVPANAPEGLYDHEAVTAAVAAAVEQANTELARVEQIKRYTVLPQFWYPDGAESVSYTHLDVYKRQKAK